MACHHQARRGGGKSILIDKTRPQSGFAPGLVRQLESPVSSAFSLRITFSKSSATSVRVGANWLEGRHDPFRLAPPHHRELAILRVPIRRSSSHNA
jgi:hypothetical protein